METLSSHPEPRDVVETHGMQIVDAFVHYYEGFGVLPEECSIHLDTATLENERLEVLVMHKTRGFFGATAFYDEASDTLSDFRFGPA